MTNTTYPKEAAERPGTLAHMYFYLQRTLYCYKEFINHIDLNDYETIGALSKSIILLLSQILLATHRCKAKLN